MNDAEREKRIKAMKQQVKQETNDASDNLRALAHRILTNGTGVLIHKAINGGGK